MIEYFEQLTQEEQEDLARPKQWMLRYTLQEAPQLADTGPQHLVAASMHWSTSKHTHHTKSTHHRLENIMDRVGCRC